MENQIVKFHNDTNRVNLGNLGVNESQLFFAICSKLNNQGSATLTFDMPEIRTMMGGAVKTNKEITAYVKRLWTNIKHADFWILLGRKEKAVMLFRSFTLIYTDDSKTELESIEISVNDEFQYLLNNFIGNFTQFELAEFNGLDGRYAKNLYRLLKQFRHTGRCDIFKNDIDGFIRLMGIPNHMRWAEMDRVIISLACKALMKHNKKSNRIPFENLKYEKIKDKSQRGRGGKVVGISFTFTPQLKEYECYTTDTKNEKIAQLRQENEEQQREITDLKMKNEKLQASYEKAQSENLSLGYAIYHGLRFIKLDKFNNIQNHRIVEVRDSTNLFNSSILEVKILNESTGAEWNMDFDSKKHLENFVKKNEYEFHITNVELMAKNRRKW